MEIRQFAIAATRGQFLISAALVKVHGPSPGFRLADWLAGQITVVTIGPSLEAMSPTLTDNIRCRSPALQHA